MLATEALRLIPSAVACGNPGCANASKLAELVSLAVVPSATLLRRRAAAAHEMLQQSLLHGMPASFVCMLLQAASALTVNLDSSV